MTNSLTPVDVDFLAAFADAAGSPSLTLHPCIEEINSGTLSVGQFIFNIEEVMYDLDLSHNAILLKSPSDSEVQEMVSKWRSSAQELFDLLESIKVADSQGDVTKDNLGMLAIIYDLLVKRLAKFSR